MRILFIIPALILLLAGCGGGSDNNSRQGFPVIEITPQDGDTIIEIELASLNSVNPNIDQLNLGSYFWGVYFDKDYSNTLSSGDLALEVRLQQDGRSLLYERDKFVYKLTEFTEIVPHGLVAQVIYTDPAITSGQSLIIQANDSRHNLLTSLNDTIPVRFYASAIKQVSGEYNGIPITGLNTVDYFPSIDTTVDPLQYLFTAIPADGILTDDANEFDNQYELGPISTMSDLKVMKINFY